MVSETSAMQTCVYTVLSPKDRIHIIGTEVHTAVARKIYVFLDITPCSQLKIYGRDGGTFSLHLQGCRYTKQEINMKQYGGDIFLRILG